MNHNTHLNWIVGIIVIVIILCGTVIYINHNSWTLRLEMDNNTLKAVESIDFEAIANPEEDKRNYVSVCNLLNDSIGYCGDGAIDPDVIEIYGDCEYKFVFENLDGKEKKNGN